MINSNQLNVPDIENNIDNKSYKFGLLIFLSMLYITFKITCNPMFFRQAELSIPSINYYFKITSAAFLFPSIYVLSDSIIALTNRKVGFFIIIFGIICDGLFSYGANYFANLDMPTIISKTELDNTMSVNLIGSKIWPLYYHGILATIIASLVEAIVFSFIYNKLFNFFTSTIISISIILVIHNLITDYFTLKHEPDVWQIIINNWVVNITILFTYGIIILGIIKSIKIWKHKSNKF